MTRTTIIPIFTPIYSGGGGDLLELCGIYTAVFAVGLGTFYILNRPRFRMELRGRKLCITRAGGSVIGRTLVHHNIISLPVKLNKPRELLYLNNAHVATVVDNTDAAQLLADCEKCGTHTIVEYSTSSLFGFDKIHHKTLYWKDAKQISVLSDEENDKELQ